MNAIATTDFLTIVTTDFLPSALLLAVGAGAVVVAIGAMLLQRAARVHMQEQRCDDLHKHVGRVEARWHEAAM
jgi:hypothetical protein